MILHRKVECHCSGKEVKINRIISFEESAGYDMKEIVSHFMLAPEEISCIV